MNAKGVAMLSMFAAALILGPRAAHAETNGRDVMLAVDQRPDGDDRRMTMRMTLTNARNRTRERSLISLSRDYGNDSKTIMQFLSPGDVRGVGFLAWEYDDPEREDDRWLYLPALRTSRRVAGSSKNDYFMGSDFTYDDMGDRSVDQDSHTLLRSEMVDGDSCWVVESIPVSDDDMYGKLVTWVRVNGDLAVKVEYFDRQGVHLKTLTTSDIRPVDGIVTAHRMEMVNHLENHRTVIELENVEYDIGLDDDLFRVNRLERGRLQ